MPAILIPAGNPSTWTGPTGNNTYLITGRVPTLIDAGVGKPEHIDVIASALQGQALAQVLITHAHPDHIEGVPAIVSRWPDVAIRQLDTGPLPIRANEVIQVGDGVVLALPTPGHSPDHCSFLEDDDLYCGDLARLGGTIVIPARRGGNLAQYLDSLRRVRALELRRLLPGHGPVIDNPAAVIDQYIRHRAERDLQILEALENGLDGPEKIAGHIYSGLAETLFRAAVDSVTAHLIKLRDENRVRERDGVWTVIR